MFYNDKIEAYRKTINSALNEKRYYYEYKIQEGGTIESFCSYKGNFVEKITSEYEVSYLDDQYGILEYTVLKADVPKDIIRELFIEDLSRITDVKAKYIFLATNYITLQSYNVGSKGKRYKVSFPRKIEIENERLIKRVLSYI